MCSSFHWFVLGLPVVDILSVLGSSLLSSSFSDLTEIVGLPSPPQKPCSALLGLTSIRMDDSCSLICGPLVDL